MELNIRFRLSHTRFSNYWFFSRKPNRYGNDNTDILSNAVCRLGGLLPSTPPARQHVCSGAVGDRGDYRLNCCGTVGRPGRVTETVIVNRCLDHCFRRQVSTRLFTAVLQRCAECGSWNFEFASIRIFWFRIRIRKLHILDDGSTVCPHPHCLPLRRLLRLLLLLPPCESAVHLKPTLSVGLHT